MQFDSWTVLPRLHFLAKSLEENGGKKQALKYLRHDKSVLNMYWMLNSQLLYNN